MQDLNEFMVENLDSDEPHELAGVLMRKTPYSNK